jgi:arabinose-5-phosphate isomerase
MKNIEVISEMVRVLKLEGQAILNCAERLKQPTVEQPFRKALDIFQNSLSKGGKIVVTGVGKSGKVGQKIAATLCSTGSFAVFIHPTEGLHGDLGVLRPHDAVLALSYTGNTEEVLKLLPSLRLLQIPLVGLGGNPKSKLAYESDAWIDGSVEAEACPHNLAPTTSTTLALALGDALALTLMQLRGFDAQAFAQNHPGGSLGKKLNLRVKDLMHGIKNIPIVQAEASIDEVIVISSEKKLGAVLVVEGRKLVGIITDGDLRRSLRHKEKFFQLKAGEVMTKSPVTADPEMMAQAALELMENRPSQIAVLPVVDEHGDWKGLIRLHDLVRAF